ncbi:MAG: beta strand repeat-containing protein [Phycisphaerae bacterium]
MRISRLTGIAVAVFVLVLGVSPVLGQISWTGDVDANAQDPANWDAAVPTSSDDVSLTADANGTTIDLVDVQLESDDVAIGDGNAVTYTLTDSIGDGSTVWDADYFNLNSGATLVLDNANVTGWFNILGGTLSVKNNAAPAADFSSTGGDIQFEVVHPDTSADPNATLPVPAMDTELNLEAGTTTISATFSDPNGYGIYSPSDATVRMNGAIYDSSGSILQIGTIGGVGGNFQLANDAKFGDGTLQIADGTDLTLAGIDSTGFAQVVFQGDSNLGGMGGNTNDDNWVIGGTVTTQLGGSGATFNGEITGDGGAGVLQVRTSSDNMSFNKLGGANDVTLRLISNMEFVSESADPLRYGWAPYGHDAQVAFDGSSTVTIEGFGDYSDDAKHGGGDYAAPINEKRADGGLGYTINVSQAATNFTGTAYFRSAGNNDANYPIPTVTANVMVADAFDQGTIKMGNQSILTFADAAAWDQSNSALIMEAGSTLVIDRVVDLGTSFASTDFQVGSGVSLEADVDFETAGNVLIGVRDYTSTLTITGNDAEIGLGGERGLYGQAKIVNQIQTGAGVDQLNFDGTGPGLAIDTLRIGKPGETSGPVITDGTAGPLSVNTYRNMIFQTDNDYTGGTNIFEDTTYVMSDGALGTGDVEISSGAVLQNWADGFDLGSGRVVVNAGGELVVQENMAADVEFAGGEIRGGTKTVSGDLFDSGDATFTGGNLTFTGGLSFTDNRTWTVEDGVTADFDGDITGGGYQLTKAGLGTLRLDGNVSNLDLVIGTSPGGTVVRLGDSGSWTGGDVTVNAQSVYGVEQAHDFSEVDMAASTGVIAVADVNNTASIDMSSASSDLSLGAIGDAEFSGTLTPGANGYQLGGGGGTLDVTSVLGGAHDLTVGFAPGNANAGSDVGQVILSAANTFTGDAHIYAPMGLGNANAFANANSVTIYSGAAIDVRDTDLHTTGAPGNWDFQSGAGMSATGQTMSQDDVEQWFTSNYVFGGPGTGTTTIESGALTSGSLTKIGSNTLKLLGTNSLGGETTIKGGVLEVSDLNAMGTSPGGFTPKLDLDGGTLHLTASDTDDRYIRVLSDSTIQVDTGEKLTMTGFVDLGLTSADLANLTVTGGGTFETTDFIYAWNPDSKVIAKDGGKVITPWVSDLRNLMFRAEDGGTVEFTGDGEFGVGMGTIRPGGAFLASASSSIRSKVSDAVSIQFAGESSKANAHQVGGEGEIWVFTNSVTGALRTDNSGNHPVAYIEKVGGGVFNAARSQQPGSFEDDVYKPYWIVKEGTLIAGGGTNALGAVVGSTTDKGGMLNVDMEGFYRSHLEGIEVHDGATLQWGGEVGFFDASVWASAYPDVDGDGWNPGEFVLYNGATLRSGGMQLGYDGFYFNESQGTLPGHEIALAYPTVGDANGGNVTFDGSINFRSGIEVAGDVPGGLLDVDVKNTYEDSKIVRFSNSLPGAVGVDVFKTLDVDTDARAGIYKTHANVQTTTVASGGALEFYGDGNALSYSGSVESDGGLGFYGSMDLSLDGDARVEEAVTAGIRDDSPADISVSRTLYSNSGTAALTVESQDANTVTFRVGGLQGFDSIVVEAGSTLELTGSGVASDTQNLTLDDDAQLALGALTASIEMYDANKAEVLQMVADDVLVDTSGDAGLGIGVTDVDTHALAMLTYKGDANVDGKVSLADLSALAGNWNSQDATWDEGDFNGDGKVSLADLSALAGNWNAGVTGVSNTAVPEPATLSLLALAGIGLLRKRK